MFPVTPILDDFNRSDTSPMTGWDSPLFGNLSANGSTCQGNTASYNIASYGTSFTGGLEAYGTISTKGATGHEVVIGAMVQQEGSLATVDGYQLRITAAAGTDTWSLERVTNGGATIIASGTQEYSSGDRFGIRVYNGVLSAWYAVGTAAFSQLGSVADSTYSGTGKLSLTLENTTLRFDDFGGGEMCGGGLLRRTRLNTRIGGNLT